jgi:hypothetical protein
MIVKAVIVWIVGLLTIVPFGTYYLLFEAQRDQYALLITSVLFWIFGYWGVVGPILAAIRVRKVFRAIELAQASGKLKEALRSDETAEVAVDLIASENKIPRFLARRVYRLLVNRFSALARAEAADGRRL